MNVLALFDTMDLPEFHILCGMLERGVNVDVLCNPEGQHVERLRKAEIPFEPLVCKSKVDFRAHRVVKNKLASKSYDIVHTYTGRTLTAALFASKQLKHRPKVVAYRGAIGNVKRSDPISWVSFMNPRVDHVVCVSKAVENYLLAAGIRPEKLSTIYKGHRLDWYNHPSTLTREQFGISEDAFLVACVANMRATKGVDILLEAAIDVADSVPIEYLLVGEIRDPKIKQLIEHPALEGKVHAVGFREDARFFARMADVFVMPSRDREGLPKGVIEAMAQGLPQIVTTVGGMPELVGNMREGLVIEKENVSALKSALVFLFNNDDLRQRFSHAAQAKIDGEFGVDTSISKTIELYQNLTSKNLKEASSA